MDRVIALVDMDCFYVQVAQRQQPHLKGKPCAVVQYKKWKGGGIIAVGYEARACGVTRSMRGDDAKAKCPEINLIRVPEVRSKADLTMFREAGAEVINVLCQFGGCVERASIDEAYIDMTEVVDRRLAEMRGNLASALLPNTFVVGWEGAEEKDEEEQRSFSVNQWLKLLQSSDGDLLNDSSDEVRDPACASFPPDLRLAMGAVIVEEMRAQVFADTGFRCSAGIAHNKMLAKLACGIHKPNRQTVLPQTAVTGLFKTLPIRKIRNLGGKFGVYLVEELSVENMADIQQFSRKHLQDKFGDKDGAWIYDLCRGYEYEAVTARNLAQSIGAGKNFPGREQLDTKEKVRYWLNQMCMEVAERLTKDKEANGRVAKNIVVSVSHRGPPSFSASKTCAIVRYDADKLTEDVYMLASKWNQAAPPQPAWVPPLHNLQVVANKFMDVADSGNIKNFFSSAATPTKTCTQNSTQVRESMSIKSAKKPDGIACFFRNTAGKEKATEDTNARNIADDWWERDTQETDDPIDAPSISSQASYVGTPAVPTVSTESAKSISFFKSFQKRQQLMNCSPGVSPVKYHVDCNLVETSDSKRETTSKTNCNVQSSTLDGTGYHIAVNNTDSMESAATTFLPDVKSKECDQNIPDDWQDKENQEVCEFSGTPSTSSKALCVSRKQTASIPEKSANTKSFFQRYHQMRNCSPSVSPIKGQVDGGEFQNNSKLDISYVMKCNRESSDIASDCSASRSEILQPSGELSAAASQLDGSKHGADEGNEGKAYSGKCAVIEGIGAGSFMSSRINDDDCNPHGMQEARSNVDTDMAPPDVEDYFPCERCNKSVLVWHLEEHMDFHVACDLQREERQQRSAEPCNQRTSQKTSSGTKRKSLSTESKQSKKKTCLEVSNKSQKIDKFFKK